VAKNRRHRRTDHLRDAHPRVSGAESLSEMQVAHQFRRSKGPQFGGSDLEER